MNTLKNLGMNTLKFVVIPITALLFVFSILIIGGQIWLKSVKTYDIGPGAVERLAESLMSHAEGDLDGLYCQAQSFGGKFCFRARDLKDMKYDGYSYEWKYPNMMTLYIVLYESRLIFFCHFNLTDNCKDQSYRDNAHTLFETDDWDTINPAMAELICYTGYCISGMEELENAVAKGDKIFNALSGEEMPRIRLQEKKWFSERLPEKRCLLAVFTVPRIVSGKNGKYDFDLIVLYTDGIRALTMPFDPEDEEALFVVRYLEKFHDPDWQRKLEENTPIKVFKEDL